MKQMAGNKKGLESRPDASKGRTDHKRLGAVLVSGSQERERS